MVQGWQTIEKPLIAMVPWEKKHYHPIVMKKWPSSKSKVLVHIHMNSHKQKPCSDNHIWMEIDFSPTIFKRPIFIGLHFVLWNPPPLPPPRYTPPPPLLTTTSLCIATSSLTLTEANELKCLLQLRHPVQHHHLPNLVRSLSSELKECVYWINPDCNWFPKTLFSQTGNNAKFIN